MDLGPVTRRTIAEHWADRLGCRADAFAEPGTTVGARQDREAVQFFRTDHATVVGAPPAAAAALRPRAEELAGLSIADAGPWFAAVLGEAGLSVTQRHGPTFFGYLDPAGFTPVESDARPLEPDDETAFDALRAAVPATEWEQADPTFVPGETVGRFRDGALVGAASLGDPPLPHVSVVVHPDYRGAGHGRALVALVSRTALDRGQTPQYRTLDAWPWSVALAESLGYERWATGVLIALE